MILPPSFYLNTDVLKVAKDLLGKVLVSEFEGKITSGIIVETEAYVGITDRASHAFEGRRTHRTEIMYMQGGVAYVYLCYGMHHLFNVVTNIADIPHAVLIRGVEPLTGIDIMLARRNHTILKPTLTAGPGALSKALGISINHTGVSLQSCELRIEDIGIKFNNNDIVSTKRIGVDYAMEDAQLPYRFFIRNNRYVSNKNK